MVRVDYVATFRHNCTARSRCSAQQHAHDEQVQQRDSRREGRIHLVLARELAQPWRSPRPSAHRGDSGLFCSFCGCNRCLLAVTLRCVCVCQGRLWEDTTTVETTTVVGTVGRNSLHHSTRRALSGNPHLPSLPEGSSINPYFVYLSLLENLTNEQLLSLYLSLP